MESLKLFAPKKYIEAITLNAEVTNMPRVGSDENIIMPAQQINLAPVVRLLSVTKSNVAMTFFPHPHLISHIE